MASQGVLVVKNLPTSAGDVRDVDSIAGLERSPGEGKGYALQYSGPTRKEQRGQRLVGNVSS